MGRLTDSLVTTETELDDIPTMEELGKVFITLSSAMTPGNDGIPANDSEIRRKQFLSKCGMPTLSHYIRSNGI